MNDSKFIDRSVSKHTYDMCKWYPVVSVTGPRQSGKSTLLKQLFPDYDYVNLEDVQLRERANNDPVGFIRSRPPRLIIDEAQNAPDLFSMVQVVVDESGEKGQYIMSGSQNFLLLKQIKQSLAGRVGLIRLFPLSFKELHQSDDTVSVEDILFSGGYPGLYSTDIPRDIFFSNYIDTYIARDISEFLKTGNLGAFSDFLQVCAEQTSNLVNLTNIGKHIEISRNTCKQWLSFLESSYIAFQLTPYFSNKIKTLTRSPKLYFYDTGLLTYLLGIKSKEELLTSEHLGKVYENFVIAETVKNYRNKLVRPDLYFYRDDSKLETDLVDMTDRQRIVMSEIKSSCTYNHKFMQQLPTITKKIPIKIDEMQLIMRTDESFNSKLGRVISTEDYLLK